MTRILPRSGEVMKKNRRAVIHFLLPIISILFATLACVGSQQYGALKSDSSPSTFTFLGEVDHTWQINMHGENYEVIIRKQNSNHPLNQIQILAGDRR